VAIKSSSGWEIFAGVTNKCVFPSGHGGFSRIGSDGHVMLAGEIRTTKNIDANWQKFRP
jgi:hypothetical protein